MRMTEDSKLNMVAYAPKASALEHHCRIYSVDGASPTIPTCQGGGHQPLILIEGTDDRLHRNPYVAGVQQPEQGLSGGGVAPTLTTQLAYSKAPLVLIGNDGYVVEWD